MRKHWKQSVAVVAALVVGSATAGAQVAQAPPVHKEAAQKPLPISQYMREVGLLYIADVGKMKEEALDDYVAFLKDPLNRDAPINIEGSIYGKALADLEDHIEINIASDGDRRFLEFLKKTKSYASVEFSEQLRKLNPRLAKLPSRPALAGLYIVCAVQAKTIIKTGEFDEGDCSSEKFHAALEADRALQAGGRLQTPAPVLRETEKQIATANSEAGKLSPGAAATADVGHVPAPEEMAAQVRAGQASPCAVVTTPPGAEIDIDGNKTGLSPMVFVLLGKGDAPRVITIKMSGYKTVEKRVVPDGKAVALGLTLEKESQ